MTNSGEKLDENDFKTMMTLSESAGGKVKYASFIKAFSKIDSYWEDINAFFLITLQ